MAIACMGHRRPPCKPPVERSLVMVGVTNRWFSGAISLQDFRLNDLHPLSALLLTGKNKLPSQHLTVLASPKRIFQSDIYQDIHIFRVDTLRNFRCKTCLFQSLRDNVPVSWWGIPRKQSLINTIPSTDSNVELFLSRESLITHPRQKSKQAAVQPEAVSKQLLRPWLPAMSEDDSIRFLLFGLDPVSYRPFAVLISIYVHKPWAVV